MQKNETSYFRSKVFKSLFLSYVLLIVIFLVLYSALYTLTYSAHYEDMTRREMQQQAAAWGTMMDQQLLSAQNVCANVNASETCRNILQTAYVEKRTIDSMQLYKMLGELKRIKGASSNLNLYGLLLSFQGDTKLYSAGSVISISGESRLLTQSPYIGETSVSALLGVTSSNLMLSKEYLIYADNYTAFNYSSVTAGSPAKGTVLVLLEKSTLLSMSRAALSQDVTGFSLCQADDVFLHSGEETDHLFTVPSLVSDSLTYCIYADPAAFHAPMSASMLLPVLLLGLLGLVFIAVTYFFSKRYYRPIDNIGQMIQRSGDKDDEIDDILDGIRG